ncbi:hypothetical protein VBL71_02870, partial [Enterobacter hormaechei]|nr:hypothetical protein [Enterobacter hormaechei]
SERIPAAAGIVNLRYKSCPEMAGQDHSPSEISPFMTFSGIGFFNGGFSMLSSLCPEWINYP